MSTTPYVIYPLPKFSISQRKVYCQCSAVLPCCMSFLLSLVVGQWMVSYKVILLRGDDIGSGRRQSFRELRRLHRWTKISFKIVVLVVVVLKSTTILKEMRIAQLSLHHQQTPNETTGFCLTLGSGQTSAAVCYYDILAKVNPPFCFLRLFLSSFRPQVGCANRLWLWQLGDDENKCDDLRFNPPLQAPCLCTYNLGLTL